MANWLRRNWDNIASNLLSNAIWFGGAAMLGTIVVVAVVAWSTIDELPGPVIFLLALFGIGTVLWIVIGIHALIARFRRPRLAGTGGELPLAECLNQGNALLGNGEPEIYANWAGSTADAIQAEYGKAKRDWFLSGAGGFSEDGMLELVNRLAILLEETRSDGERNEDVVAQFFESREELNRIRGGLAAELSGVDTAWAVWPVGTFAQAHNVFERTGKPQKLILTNPWHTHIRNVAELFDRSADELESDILITTRLAHRAGVEVFWFNGPITSMLFGNPHTDDAWVRVEIVFVLSNDRPSIVISKRGYPKLYDSLRSTFEMMLDGEATVRAYERIAQTVWLHYQYLQFLDLELTTEKTEEEIEKERKEHEGTLAKLLRSACGPSHEKRLLDAGSGYGKSVQEKIVQQKDCLQTIHTELLALAGVAAKPSESETEGPPPSS